MRKLGIGFLVVLSVLWAGTVWAAKALVPETGQTTSFDTNIPPRDDGALQKGVKSPAQRFTDKGKGVIKDNLTGLIWLKNAFCSGTARTWQTALNDMAELNTSGTMNGQDCGDTRAAKEEVMQPTGDCPTSGNSRA